MRPITGSPQRGTATKHFSLPSEVLGTKRRSMRYPVFPALGPALRGHPVERTCGSCQTAQDRRLSAAVM